MLPSVTIPSQTLTVRQIMDRYKRGMPLEGRTKTPLYYNGEFPDLKNMDLSEIDSLRKQVNNDVKTLQQTLQQQEQDKINQQVLDHQNYVKGLEEKIKAFEAK